MCVLMIMCLFPVWNRVVPTRLEISLCVGLFWHSLKYPNVFREVVSVMPPSLMEEKGDLWKLCTWRKYLHAFNPINAAVTFYATESSGEVSCEEIVMYWVNFKKCMYVEEKFTFGILYLMYVSCWIPWLYSYFSAYLCF